MKPEVAYARNGEVALAYQVVGSGPRDLLIVSGFLSNIEYAWEYPSLSRFLSRLAETSRVILTDRRGSGLSDRFREAPPQEAMLSDLEIVLDAVASPKATLLGIWDGCATSILFAAAHPERVSSLVLFSASGTQKVTEDHPWAWSEEEWETWLASIRDGWGTRAWSVKNARWMGPGLLEDPDEMDRWISYIRLAASPSSAEAVMQTSSDLDIREILPIVRTPTLVLHRVGDMTESIESGRYVAARMPNARLVELPGDDSIPWIGNVDSVLTEIRSFLGESVQSVSSDRRLATVLFTDIVGSTERLATLGDAAWRDVLAKHDALARRTIANHGGHYVDSTGDGLVATFDGPAAAVRCAMALADAVETLGLEIRAGCHTGEIEIAGEHIRGIAVHIAARICALAQPSACLVSPIVKDLVAGSGLTFDDSGEHELKGVPDRWRLHRALPA